MSEPEHPIASLLQGAITAGLQGTAHVAVSMVAVACGYLLPHAAHVITAEDGVVEVVLHSPWRTLRGKPLPRKTQGKAMRQVQRALDNYFRLFPKSQLPTIVLFNCPRCVRGDLCDDVRSAMEQRAAIKRVQDALDAKGWTAGSLDMLPAVQSAPYVVVVHGYLIDKQTVKPVTDAAWADFAKGFREGALVGDQPRVLVKRCVQCQQAKHSKDEACPPQQSSEEGQSFAV